MTLDELIAMITALQEAGTDEAIIKKMVLSALAEDQGASVDVPASDGATGMGTEPPADQGATPVTSQPMAARNPAPAAKPAVRPPAAKPATTASYGAKPAAAPMNRLQMLASLIGTGIKAATTASYGAKPAAAPVRPPAAKPPAARPMPAPQAYSEAPETQTAEDLLEENIFNQNEANGVHTGQNSAFLRKLLRQNPALYAEAIEGRSGVTAGDGGASPYVTNQPALAATSGPLAERNAFANKIKSYRNAELQAGRPCTYSEAMDAIILQRGPSK